jgi:hypothetical protein
MGFLMAKGTIHAETQRCCETPLEINQVNASAIHRGHMDTAAPHTLPHRAHRIQAKRQGLWLEYSLRLSIWCRLMCRGCLQRCVGNTPPPSGVLLNAPYKFRGPARPNWRCACQPYAVLVLSFRTNRQQAICSVLSPGSHLIDPDLSAGVFACTGAAHSFGWDGNCSAVVRKH